MEHKEERNKVEEAKETVEEATKLATAAASGNIASAAKSAAKLAKSSAVKKARKRKLMTVLAGALAIMLVLVSFYAIIMTVQDTLIGLMSNVTTSVSNFWKWMRDDYWIKLDKEIEFSYLDEDTRAREEK